jgi:hypothetical protein
MITVKLSESSGLRAQLQEIGMASRSSTLTSTAFTARMLAPPASIISKITVWTRKSLARLTEAGLKAAPGMKNPKRVQHCLFPTQKQIRIKSLSGIRMRRGGRIARIMVTRTS